MLRIRKSAFPVIIAIALLFSKTTAVAQTPPALVLEKKGSTSPEVQPYTEIFVGKTITLSPKASIMFQHYHSCRTVTVAGGAVEFTAKTYFITKGGKKKHETNTPCPKTVTLQAGSETGGVLMRSMLTRNSLTLSHSPTFILVGKRAHDFTAVRVSRRRQQLLESPLVGRRFQWLSQAKTLEVDTEYELILIPKVQGSMPVKNKFKVSNSDSIRANIGLILLRID